MSRKMKDSGVAWIGEIPENFIMIKTKYLCNVRNGLTYSPADLCDEDKGVLVLRSSNIKDGTLIFDDNVYVNCGIKSELMVKRGDILLCSRNGSKKLIGKNAIIENDINASFGAFMMIVRGAKNPKYMYYILNSNIFSYYLGTFLTATINQLTGANFSNMVIPYCEDEKIQNKIVTYLDKKCSQIDALISNQQKQIEKLKQYKQSVITEAVTKGLNPDAEMKDSGVEWIGEIPREWNYQKSFYVCEKIGDIDHYMPNSVAEGYPYVMTGDLKQNVSEIDFDKCKQISEDDYRQLSKKVVPTKGDILFARYATIGTVCYVDVDKKFLVSYSCVTIKPKSNVIEGKYLWYYYQSIIFLEEVKKLINANTQANVGMEALYRANLLIPPLNEQMEIAKYLDEKCNKIDSLIAIKEQKIEKLNQYKRSVIYEYVTGKKEA